MSSMQRCMAKTQRLSIADPEDASCSLDGSAVDLSKRWISHSRGNSLWIP